MLSNTFEWERLVHPTPTDEMVTTRKAIVGSLLSAFDSQQDLSEAFGLVSAAITGLNPSIQADVDYAESLTEVTRGHRPAFPSSLAENAQDLQLSAAIVVGELLSRKPAHNAWKEPITMMAALTATSYGLRSDADGLHLASVKTQLLSQADSLLARDAVEIRVRPEFKIAAIEEFAAQGDVPTFWSAFKPILQRALVSLADASAIDRDELEVLWWIYNDTSSTFSKKFSEMTAYDVALASAMEVADRALCPAPASLKNIVQGLVARAEKKASAPGKALKAVIGGWSSEVLAALVPADSDAKTQAQSCPKLLPLTWIAIKIADSGVTTGWEQEFDSRTGMKATRKVTPETIADQVFAERTAQRLLLPLCGE